MQPAEESSLNGKPSAEEVGAALDRLLANRLFQSATTQARLLRYIVEKTATGSAGELKEAVVAIEVFGRSSSFDSRSDSIVRVEARKLRDSRARYYAGEGATDPIRITIPKGGYGAVFETRIDSPPTPAVASSAAPAHHSPRVVWTASALLALLVIGAAWATLF